MRLKKDQTSKMIILLVIVILFNLIFPIHSYAGFFSGILTRPICYLVVSVTDSINVLLNSLMVSTTSQIGDTWNSIAQSDDPFSALLSARNSQFMSPDKIFMRKSSCIKCKYI